MGSSHILQTLNTIFFSPIIEKNLLLQEVSPNRTRDINQLLALIEHEIVINHDALKNDKEISFKTHFDINLDLHKDILSTVRVKFNQSYCQMRRLDRKMALCFMGGVCALTIGAITLPYVFIPLGIAAFFGMAFYWGKRKTLDAKGGTYEKALKQLTEVYIWAMNDTDANLKNNEKDRNVYFINDECSNFDENIKDFIQEIFPMLSKEEFLSFTRNDKHNTDTLLYEFLSKELQKENKLTKLHYLLYGTGEKRERSIFSCIGHYLKEKFTLAFFKPEVPKDVKELTEEQTLTNA